VLLIGVSRLREFTYADIEEWARRSIAIVAEHYSGAVHIASTAQGSASGLDEIEALHAQIRGILSGAREASAPGRIIRVSIVERSAARAERLQAALAEIMVQPSAALTEAEMSHIGEAFHRGLESPMAVRRPLRLKLRRPSRERDQKKEQFADSAEVSNLESAEQVEHKPRAFVAMPFSEEMEDVFYYGIQNPVRQLGYICERVDQEAFTGDILEQVKTRIENAEIVIADLTGSNPNVYLEVGYAWGKGRPTVLVANKKDELKFDVRGQRCLKYQSIKDLEKLLTSELKGLATRTKQ
jgi:hypothetical protein